MQWRDWRLDNIEKPKEIIYLTKKKLRAGLEFAKTYVNWAATKWRTVLFSDAFDSFDSDGLKLMFGPYVQ